MHIKISKYQQGDLELFDTIGIETSEYCNRTCSFCPNSINRQERRLMSVELYEKIINQLVKVEFAGTICFNQYNEPLLDKRLDKFILFARQKLPNSRLTISTNGDALTIKRWDSLKKNGLDFAVISQYDGVISKNIQNLIEVEMDKNSYKVEIRSELNLKSTRCGTVNFDNSNLPLNENCLRPFSQFVIRYSGLAVLCCEDYFAKEILGDLKKENLYDIWHSKKLNLIRDSLILNKRKGICSKCNVTYNSTVDSCEFIKRN